MIELPKLIKKTPKEKLIASMNFWNRKIQDYAKELQEVKSWPDTAFSGMFGSRRQRIAFCIREIRACKKMRRKEVGRHTALASTQEEINFTSPTSSMSH